MFRKDVIQMMESKEKLPPSRVEIDPPEGSATGN
jgi:hypothetical protein